MLCLNRALTGKRLREWREKKGKKEREIERDNLFVYLGGNWKEDKGNGEHEFFVLKNHRRKWHRFIQIRK